VSKTHSFLTGTWYQVTVPDDWDGDLEEVYSQFWDGDLPDGVEVEEIEVSHIWDDELK